MPELPKTRSPDVLSGCFDLSDGVTGRARVADTRTAPAFGFMDISKSWVGAAVPYVKANGPPRRGSGVVARPRWSVLPRSIRFNR